MRQMLEEIKDNQKRNDSEDSDESDIDESDSDYSDSDEDESDEDEDEDDDYEDDGDDKMDGFIGPDFDHMTETQLRIISCLETIKTDLQNLSPDEMVVIFKMMEDMEKQGHFEEGDEDTDK